MSSNSEKLNDRWFRILGVPSVALVANVLFFSGKGQQVNHSFFTQLIHSVIHSLVIWELARLIILWTRRRFASFADTNKRINYSLVLVTLTTAAVMGSICAIYDFTGFWGYHFTFQKYIYNIFVALMYAVVIGGIYEGIYFFRKWREAFVEAEALKKANLQSQLDSLKGQINPHFLFNSLSSLSSLIVDDSQRAERFVDELAAVYRYLLKTNDNQVTTLARELDFISAYYHLLKTRFSNGICMTIDVSESCKEFFIPPLTLQILVENAVKHNIILPSKPLKINVYTDEDDNLVVINNLQKKQSSVLSNRLGLANIETKYQLLRQPKLTIRETDAQFKVIVPLIKQEVYAYNDR